VPAGTELIRRQHLVRSDEQQPVELGASWFRPEDAENTSLVRDVAFGRPLYQEVEEVTGRRYATATDQLTARLPTRDEAQVLHIRADTPVLHLLHVAFDAQRRPIEVAQATWPGPMTTLTESYPVPAEPAPLPDGPDAALA
jgi:GntR family transcriptional regulator